MNEQQNYSENAVKGVAVMRGMGVKTTINSD